MKERKVYVAPLIDLADIESEMIMTSDWDLGGPSSDSVLPPTIEGVPTESKQTSVWD